MERIYTTPLLDKVGVKPGARVAIIGVPDTDFRALLAQRTADVIDGWPAPETDLVFLGAESIDDLLRIGPLQESIVSSGAIWVVSRKGKAATLRDVDVIEAAKAVGLVDNKVALRLVIPVARRGVPSRHAS